MSKTIIIDGQTYTGIESVSVNGNVFGSSSDYTEQVLRRNFNPNGQGFYDEVAINLADGDYIEAQFDNANETAMNCVFSVGRIIDYYPSASHSGSRIIIFSKQYDNTYYSIGMLYSADTDGTIRRDVCKTKSPSGTKTNIKVSAAGIYFNDNLILPSEYTMVDTTRGSSRDFVMEDLLTATTLRIGADYHDSGVLKPSTVQYDYIKVFKKI